MPPKTMKTWRERKGSQLLIDDIRRGCIPATNADINQAYESRAEYGGSDNNERKKFTRRLKDAQSKAIKLQTQAKADHEDLVSDRQLNPIKVENYLGEPRWDGSAAQLLLRKDVNESVHMGVHPKDLHATRLEYKEFNLRIFREHLYQEIRRQKYMNDKFNHRRKASET